jgi:hypothetical protein
MAASESERILSEELRSHRFYRTYLARVRWELLALAVLAAIASVISFGPLLPAATRGYVRFAFWVPGAGVLLWFDNKRRGALDNLRQGLPEARLPRGFWLRSRLDLVVPWRTAFRRP